MTVLISLMRFCTSNRLCSTFTTADLPASTPLICPPQHRWSSCPQHRWSSCPQHRWSSSRTSDGATKLLEWELPRVTSDLLILTRGADGKLAES